MSEASQHAEWPKPKELKFELAPVPTLDLDILPRCLRELALDAAERMSVPIDFTAVASIVALAGAVNRRAFVYPKQYDKTWKEALNLWGAVVSNPGKMKTPVVNAITRPHVEIEKKWRKEHQKAMQEYNRAVSASQNSGAHDELDGDDVERAVPAEPAMRRLLVNDITPEKLHSIMAENKEGVLVIRDELSGWMAELEKKGRETQRDLFVQSWNGNQWFTVDRIERGSVYAVVCLSMFGSMQPHLLQEFMSSNNERNINDGTFQRFQLLIWPDSKPFVNVDRRPSKDALENAEQVVQFLAEMHAETLSFHFCADAQLIFNEWITQHQYIVDAERYEPKQAHLAKYRGLMPRLAALFQLTELAAACPVSSDDEQSKLVGSQFISESNTRRAIALCEYLAGHLERIYSCEKSLFVIRLEELARHIQAGDLQDGFTSRDVARKSWKYLAVQEDAEAVLEELDEMGWLRIMLQPKHRGQPTRKWEINPDLWQVAAV
jgi:Protein of unknown function (DUF3987)